MTQTTEAMNGVNAHVAVSADGLTWVDVSGSANQVTTPEQRRMSGEAYTFRGDTAILGAGRREPVELAVRALYTEEALEAWAQTRAFFEALGGDRIWLRWAPDPVLGSIRFIVQRAIVTRFTYPSADAAEAAPIPCEMTFRCPEITNDWMGGIPPAELEALVALYAELDGSSWTDDTNWLSDEHEVDDWFGVTVDGGHVTEISLADNGLEDGTLPGGWAEALAQLELLDVGDNGLSTATVNSIIDEVFAARMVFEAAVKELNVGGTNGAPTGTVQAPSPCPAANPGERVWELAHDSCGDGHTLWMVVYDGANVVP